MKPKLAASCADKGTSDLCSALEMGMPLRNSGSGDDRGGLDICPGCCKGFARASPHSSRWLDQLSIQACWAADTMESKSPGFFIMWAPGVKQHSQHEQITWNEEAQLSDI